MVCKVLVNLVIVCCIVNPSLQDVHDNQVEDSNPFAEAAAAILREQSAESIGGLVNNLLQSGGANTLMQGLGSLMTQKQIDPNFIASMLMSMTQPADQGENREESSFDTGAFLSMLGGFFGDGKKSPMEYLPMLVQTISSFVGPEADARAKSHEDHSWFVPPVLEKLHVFADNFMHSDMGKQIINTVGAEKFVKIFSDEQGKFSYAKFVDMLENHSFRRHWISMVTQRLAILIKHVADPRIHKRYLNTAQQFANSILKTQGFPKKTLLDLHRPTESITSMVNYAMKFYFNVQFSSKQYVKPAVEYVQELLQLAQQRGILSGSGMDSRQLSDKLADTINMEIIEPIARVNRAYRFAKKVKECDQYVMCLVNAKEQDADANVSLPGLKNLLSKTTSVAMSWFLSTHTGTPFWELYNIIMEDTNCQKRFLDSCNDFHVEEVRVTTEYVHNEL